MHIRCTIGRGSIDTRGFGRGCPAQQEPRAGPGATFRPLHVLQTIHPGRSALALRLHIILGSTRPGRVGATVARWFHDSAIEHGRFDPVELVDLAEFGLPVYDEPRHPVLQQYEHEHTRRWSASVAAADAFVFVTPEYNYGPAPALLNALDYVYKEWNYKPAAFVSYGGMSGGIRAVQVTKQTLTTLKMVPLVEAVVVQMVAQQLDEDKQFKPSEVHVSSAKTMLDELLRWAEALKPLRGPT
jgi:NAD(P)H-dependent FMN reductase